MLYYYPMVEVCANNVQNKTCFWWLPSSTPAVFSPPHDLRNLVLHARSTICVFIFVVLHFCKNPSFSFWKLLLVSTKINFIAQLARNCLHIHCNGIALSCSLKSVRSYMPGESLDTRLAVYVLIVHGPDKFSQLGLHSWKSKFVPHENLCTYGSRVQMHTFTQDPLYFHNIVCSYSHSKIFITHYTMSYFHWITAWRTKELH